jgi:type 1 glutamine amidotransferase
MARCVLISGAGDYADPWHPFDTTASLLAAILEPVAGAVAVRTDVDEALAEQTGATDLLVVSIGDAGPGTPTEAARTGLRRHLEAGGPLLVLHVSVTAFPDWPDWEAIVGGRWVQGTTFHPEKGIVAVRIDPGHPIAAGLRDFVSEDEAYTALRARAGVILLAHHDFDGSAHPLGWAHRYGEAPVVYLALGHDGGAYDAEGTRELVRRSARWLLQTRTRAG